MSRLRLVKGNSFETDAPLLSDSTSTKTGATTATGTVQLYAKEQKRVGDLLYVYTTTNDSQTEEEILLNGTSQAATYNGNQDISLTSLSSGTTYYIHTVYVGTVGRKSLVETSPSFDTDPAASGINVLRLRREGYA